MVLCVWIDLGMRDGTGPVMTLIVPAKHIFIKVKPILIGVARRPHPDYGSAFGAVGFKAVEFFSGGIEAACEN